MGRLIGGRPADGLVQHELTVGDEIRWATHPPWCHRTGKQPLQASRSETAQQLRFKQTHHRLQILGTGVKPQEVLPDGREIAPGQCLWGFKTSGGAAAIHPLDPVQDLLLGEGRFQFRVDRLRQRRFGEDVGIRVVFNPLDRLEATEPLHHQRDANDPSLADLSSSKPDSGADGQWRDGDGGC